ncbi:exodeoxyribonuclease VII large subunit [Deinococcus metallilatus]|uniref:Exodeoxyribonuclease 7 large subunit n=1 Tax=Deinococcus metallilatus TaxID=1211322 RepID=A0AAJ5F5N6_9DEIO|nr:exodeoxyribonuclease VII large subunit [Deinococcus metallilatus]MBB5297149.1 exodeoxyribonuclease VII large subunit [Deinococcus metallilatus]QBY10065.1 exodeoxyribonuclease VII large subunit [Deinococcus metallilatus]RXJ08320.1 exodeoxyribonuclease VII large subunit [Deinococcus metallilatus]TLK21970.1 exodeoxyribonuclease VII large subunit [Deinococcus metallilatus]GMA17286.1 exodeoxyribonuclease 7 large subunit [Deinococcus metallilatus]
MTGRKRKKAEVTRTPEHFLDLADVLVYVGQVIARGVPGAVWVRAEIASLTDRRHLYLDLVQLEDGVEVAKCRATVWARERYALEGKFRRATGGTLTAGLKVLLFCTAEFHPQYGFSLNVLDVAPEFTLGDAALKLDALREALVREGVYGLNRALPAPADFARVAVISPAEAAGLGDFRRETDALEAAGVVEFLYLEATFQGREASGSLTGAIAEAREAHQEEPLDALVVIRGGGAVTDLAWLNDLEVARALATFPAPVITGLGHARDDTLLDEVACLRTDTPSKAAGLIVRTVVAAAAQAQEDARTIRAHARNVLVNAEAGTRWLLDRVLGTARRQADAAQAQTDALMRQALGLTPERTLARGYALVRDARGRPVTHAAQVKPGQALTLEFGDGVRRVRALDGAG